MSETINVPCLRCKGKGSYERDFWSHNCKAYHTRTDVGGCPNHIHFCNPCDLCNGYGVLVATELRAVTKAELAKDVMRSTVE